MYFGVGFPNVLRATLPCELPSAQPSDGNGDGIGADGGALQQATQQPAADLGPVVAIVAACGVPQPVGPDGGAGLESHLSLVCVVTASAVTLWCAAAKAQLAVAKRTVVSVHDLGRNQYAQWRRDRQSLVVSTDKGHLIFYSVERDADGRAFQFRCRPGHEPAFGFAAQATPAVRVATGLHSGPANTASVMHTVTSLVVRDSDVIVGTTAGVLERVPWDEGFFDATAAIVLAKVQFAQWEPAILPGVFAVSMDYCKATNVLGIALSDGTAACISTPILGFEHKVRGAWVPAVPSRPFRRISSAQEAQSKQVAINSRYRLLAVGCDNGDVHVYNVDETLRLSFSHSLWHSSHEANASVGASQQGTLSQLAWSPDGCALALSLSRGGGLTLWSVFGCRLMSFNDQEDSHHVLPGLRHICWGPEGYSLFAAASTPAVAEDAPPASSTRSAKTKSPASTTSSGGGGATSSAPGDAPTPARDGKLAPGSRAHTMSPSAPGAQPSNEILQLRFLKSTLARSSNTDNQRHAALHGEDRICLGGIEGGASRSVDRLCDMQWQSIEMPHTYVAEHWPVRHVALNRTGQLVAIAGSAGFAHFNLTTRKWRTFGNQVHELEIQCRGGLVWWSDYLLFACWNGSSQSHELRCYNRHANLDNRNVVFVRSLRAGIACMSVFSDFLVVCTTARKAILFRLQLRASGSAAKPRDVPAATPRLVPAWEMDLSEHVPHISNLVSLTLVRVGTEGQQRRDLDSDLPGGLIANVAGRLLMFSIEAPDKPRASANFVAPVLLSTGVENYWAPAEDDVTEPHLRDALWLGCGVAGMKAWLPLYTTESDGPPKPPAQPPADDAAATGGDPGGGGPAAAAQPAVGARAASGATSPTAPAVTLTKRVMLPFRLTVCPLSVLFKEGIILGAAIEPHYSSGKTPLLFPTCALERRTQLFLHLILRQMLRRNLDEHAKQICASCCSLEYFPHVLELLLHEVLEDEANDGQLVVPEDALLPRIVAFLSRYPNWLDVLVQCARKTEVAKWGYLFSIAGNPRDLFETCVSGLMYPTAASFLMVMQSLESAVESRKQALRLLNIALWEERWDLTRDLIRFLEATADPAEHTRDSPVPAAINGAHGEIAVKVLGDHARKLLCNGQLSLFGRFAENVDFEVTPWLTDNRFQRGCHIQDFAHVLAKVHAAYSWPFPGEDHSPETPESLSASPVKRSSLSSASGTATPIADSTAGSLAEPGPQPLDTETARLELEYLMNFFFEASCYDWAFLLAVMLQDSHAVSQVLEEIAGDKECEEGIFGLLSRFKLATEAPPGSAYAGFGARIRNTVRMATPVPSDIERERRAPVEGSPPAAAGSDCVVS